MSEQFDWQIGEDEDELELQSQTAVSQPSRMMSWILLTAVLVAGLWWGRRTLQNQLSSSERDLLGQVQTALDFERDAYLAGDGELFYSFQADDPAWFAAQLQPENGRLYQHTPTVTDVQQYDNFVWANLQWTEGSQTLQRVAFWEAQPDGVLVRQPRAPGYWGSFTFVDFDWGKLRYYQTDADYSEAIGLHASETIADLCADDCPLPFIISIVDHYGETAVPNHIQVPSPRLVSLDSNGAPSPSFWFILDQRIAERLSPATIKFAVPPANQHNIQYLVNYEQAAAQFMALHPNITIELTLMETVPDDLSVLASAYDGAAVTPSKEMLMAGLVYDLTPFIKSDPEFNESDFYEQIWQGALWQERVWIIPQAAQMRVLYYDSMAYQAAGLPEPSLRLTWNELAQDISTLAPHANQDVLQWGFLDTGLDSLYSYAFNWNNQCTLAATVLCQTPLRSQNVAAALEWYRQMIVQEQSMPNLVEKLPELLSPVSLAYLNEKILPYQREEFLLSNLQSSRRTAAIWVDVPVGYEYQVLLAPMGVVPFPGSDRFDGITPLRVQGNFISQASERPFAVWQWIKFLSDQRPAPRYVPARPSVANQMGFWRTLPHPLGDVMRTAFPFAKPITIEERSAITWEQVTAVVSGELTPTQAANQHNNTVWFNQPN